MCTVLLPPGVNPIAVNKYIISYHITSEAQYYFFGRTLLKDFTEYDYRAPEYLLLFLCA